MANILRTLLKGMYDSSKGFVMAFRIDNELKLEGDEVAKLRKASVQQTRTKKEKPAPTVMASLAKSVTINIVLLILFGLVFNYAIIPFIRYYVSGAAIETAELIFVKIGHVYYYPTLIVTSTVNTIYHNDISKVMHKYTGGRAPPAGNRVAFTMTSDFSYSIIFHLFYYYQVLIVEFILVYGSFPWTATVTKIILVSLGLSLAAFEYKWFDMYVPLSSRLYYVEKNWVYYLGFSLPWVFIDHYCLQIRYFSGGLLRCFMPFLIVSAYLAEPVDANSPRIPVFYGVIFTTNKIIAAVKAICNLGNGTKKTPKPAFYGQRSHSD